MATDAPLPTVDYNTHHIGTVLFLYCPYCPWSFFSATQKTRHSLWWQGIEHAVVEHGVDMRRQQLCTPLA